MLAYLILHADQPQSRQHLAFQLWPDTTESNARNNLRQYYFQLRHALPDADRYLVADASTICWKTGDGQEIDLLHFEDSLRTAAVAEQNGEVHRFQKLLEEALSDYRGDLLPGCYDDWIGPERDRLRRMYIRVCQNLIGVFEKQSNGDRALQIAERLLRVDPLDEETYIQLMRLYGLKDDYANIRRTYQAAVETLQRELGVEPGKKLQDAYQRLQEVFQGGPAANTDLAPDSGFRLVGRRDEWLQIQSAWHRAAKGEAHLFLISGEAGIGKSRLAEELFTWTTRQGFIAAYTRSYGVEGRLSLAPVTEWLRNPLIRPHLANLDRVWLTEIARLLPELLVEHPGLERPELIMEYGRRQLFFEGLARGILSGRGPLLLWIDDLQWCDQETLDWLHFLLRYGPQKFGRTLGTTQNDARHVSNRALLVLGTARSEEIPPQHPLSLLVRQLRMENKITTLELSALDAAETANLAAQVQGSGLSDMEIFHLFHETDGNPLFVVETVRARMAGSQGVENGSADESRAYSPQMVPPRVHSVILGRLVQLSPPARKVAEIGAAVGRAFTLELLLSASHEDAESITQSLDELWQKRIIREQDANLFDFTHDKLREVAYAEISAPQRRYLHRRIAEALEARFTANLDPFSPQVAFHYEQAGFISQAVPYYLRAGAVAAGVYANEDAIRLYNRGLELLEQLPPDPGRDAQELEMQLALATLYRISKGWTSPEEERVINRAMVLSEKAGDADQRIRVLIGLQSLYVVKAQHELVEQAYAEMESLFIKSRGEPPQPYVAVMLAGAQLSLGHLSKARQLFDAITSLRDKKYILDQQESLGVNYLVHGMAWGAHALWCLGYPRQALNMAQAAVGHAAEYDSPFNQALSVTYQAMLSAWCGDQNGLLADAEAAYRIAEEYQVTYYSAWAKILLGFALAEQQPGSESLANLKDAIHTFIESGARIRLPVYYSMYAQVCLKAGQTGEGLAALDLAQAESQKNREHWWDAEILRLRGELLRAAGASIEEAETHFQRAIAIAEEQQAKSLELRAAISLAGLPLAESRRAETRQLLVHVYDWFAEGFDTPDLQSARALIGRW